METKELKNLVNSVLDNNAECNVSIDIWHPTIKEIKFLLNLGHDKIDPNNTGDSCTIFGVWFDKYDYSRTPAFRFVMFCNETGAKFMRRYYKEKGGN